jgi:hypothetical protein
MPHHYVLHKLKAHPRFHHLKKHLSHFSKSHPKTSSLFSSMPTRNEISAVMQGEGIRRFPNDSGMHTTGSGHRKKLHPLKFKI